MSYFEGERPIVNIIRGSIDSLIFYEVTEDELSLLENGPSSSLYLNFTIALITLSISFFASIFTVEFKNYTTFVVFLVIALVSGLVGLGYGFTWYRSRNSYTAIIKKIKARAEAKTAPVVVADPTAPDEIVPVN